MDKMSFQVMERMQKEHGKLDPKVQSALDTMNEARIVGVEILKRAGLLFQVEGDAILNIKAELIEIDSDVAVTTQKGRTISIEYKDDTPRIVIDGLDLTGLVDSITINLRPRSFPSIGIRMAPGTVPINASDIHVKK